MALLQKNELEAARASTADRRTQGLDNCSTQIWASAPLGATVCRGGVGFSLFSRKASVVELLLFNREDDARPARVISIDPATNRTYHYWHIFVPDLQPGQIYGYRVDGPVDPANGQRFDPAKVLLDPYGRGVAVPQTTTARRHVEQETTLRPR
jgi:glycogen operon protein